MENRYSSTLYELRIQDRKDKIKSCESKLSVARAVLYFLPSSFLILLFFLLTDKIIFGFEVWVSIFINIGIIGLTVWSKQKPFSSFLIIFILTTTSLLLHVWRDGFQFINSIKGAYTILAYSFIIYLVLRAIKAAYSLALLEEENQL